MQVRLQESLTFARFVRHSVQALVVTNPKPLLRLDRSGAFWAVEAAPDEPGLTAEGIGTSAGARCSSVGPEPKGMTSIGGPRLLGEGFSSIGSMGKVGIRRDRGRVCS